MDFMYGEPDAFKSKVLVVDDDLFSIMMLSAILNKEYEVSVEKNGVNAAKTAAKLRPDLILLDIVMPDTDGFQIINTLKNMDETKDIPIIFITSLSASDTEQRGLMLGAADYISKPFTPEIVKLRVLNQIKIVNQMKTISKLGMTDSLTGLRNRRLFNTLLDQEWQRALREQLSLSILMMDIDCFKEYNDTYGHLQGDMALQHVAKCIVDSLKRTSDIASRWGGDEFAVILPNTNLNGAVNVAESIRDRVEECAIQSEGDSVKLTVSIGVNTVLPDPQATVYKLIKEADDALFKAKKLGRNQVYANEDAN